MSPLRGSQFPTSQEGLRSKMTFGVRSLLTLVFASALVIAWYFDHKSLALRLDNQKTKFDRKLDETFLSLYAKHQSQNISSVIWDYRHLPQKDFDDYLFGRGVDSLLTLYQHEEMITRLGAGEATAEDHAARLLRCMEAKDTDVFFDMAAEKFQVSQEHFPEIFSKDSEEHKKFRSFISSALEVR